MFRHLPRLWQLEKDRDCSDHLQSLFKYRADARPSNLMQHSSRLDGGGCAVFDTKLHIDLLKMLVHRAR